MNNCLDHKRSPDYIYLLPTQTPHRKTPAEPGFKPATSSLWGNRATTPLCCPTNIYNRKILLSKASLNTAWRLKKSLYPAWSRAARRSCTKQSKNPFDGNSQWCNTKYPCSPPSALIGVSVFWKGSKLKPPSCRVWGESQTVLNVQGGQRESGMGLGQKDGANWWHPTPVWINSMLTSLSNNW